MKRFNDNRKTRVVAFAEDSGAVSRVNSGILLAVVLCALWLFNSNVVTANETPALSPPEAEQEWRFRVFLDDKEIGYHEFLLEDNGAHRVLKSTAEFEYKLLFVKLYEYQHDNSEIWQGNCLQRIESSTDANGKPYSVTGERQEYHFAVQSNQGEATLPPCVMSFAYWNPDFLQQTHLLNSQDGEYLAVDVSQPVYDPLPVRGETIDAWRYELSAGKLQMELWYSKDHQWLGLASQAEGGRTLRYELL